MNKNIIATLISITVLIVVFFIFKFIFKLDLQRSSLLLLPIGIVLVIFRSVYGNKNSK